MFVFHTFCKKKKKKKKKKIKAHSHTWLYENKAADCKQNVALR